MPKTAKKSKGPGIKSSIGDALVKRMQERLTRPERQKERDKQKRLNREIKHKEQGEQASTETFPLSTVKIGGNCQTTISGWKCSISTKSRMWAIQGWKGWSWLFRSYTLVISSTGTIMIVQLILLQSSLDWWLRVVDYWSDGNSKTTWWR